MLCHEHEQAPRGFLIKLIKRCVGNLLCIPIQGVATWG